MKREVDSSYFSLKKEYSAFKNISEGTASIFLGKKAFIYATDFLGSRPKMACRMIETP